MTFNYTYTTEMIIIFDEKFQFGMTGSLTEAADTIKFYMEEYNFTCADVVDKKTGEILLMAKYPD